MRWPCAGRQRRSPAHVLELARRAASTGRSGGQVQIARGPRHSRGPALARATDVILASDGSLWAGGKTPMAGRAGLGNTTNQTSCHRSAATPIG